MVGCQRLHNDNEVIVHSSNCPHWTFPAVQDCSGVTHKTFFCRVTAQLIHQTNFLRMLCIVFQLVTHLVAQFSLLIRLHAFFIFSCLKSM